MINKPFFVEVEVFGGDWSIWAVAVGVGEKVVAEAIVMLNWLKFVGAGIVGANVVINVNRTVVFGTSVVLFCRFNIVEDGGFVLWDMLVVFAIAVVIEVRFIGTIVVWVIFVDFTDVVVFKDSVFRFGGPVVIEDDVVFCW